MDLAVEDFMYFISDFVAMFVQDGKRTMMCDFINDYNKKENLESLIDLAREHGSSFEDYDRSIVRETKIDTHGYIRQWSYQYCTEFGWYQMANTNQNLKFRSGLVSDKYFNDLCQDIFESKIKYGPAVAENNAWFHGLDITGSNILFMTASDDPWKHAGMIELKHPESSQKDMVAHHVECVDCAHCVDL